jgi:hypothetical protein
MARRHESAHVDWKHLAVYGLAVAAVLLVGGLAIWSFIERQSLVIQPDPLPKITVVTQDAKSPLAASWVRLLTKAELNPTLVPIATFDPIEGVVVFCDIPEIPPRLAEALAEFVRRGGALAFVGEPPSTRIGSLLLKSDSGMSDPVIKLGENASPVLARLIPGYLIKSKETKVATLMESPQMQVDARWAKSARAVAMHMERDGARYLWFGFDPASVSDQDPQILLMLRSAFRWVAGQPVSDGAVGGPQVAKNLTPDGRRQARENKFVFSVDRSPNPRVFTVRMVNRGGLPLPNPTIKLWLPPRVTGVSLAGDIIMKRNATLTGLPDEGACLISLPSLTRNEERMLKRHISNAPAGQVADRAAGKATAGSR